MATHKSAEKRHRQNLKRRAANRSGRAAIRSTLRRALELAEKKDFTGAREAARNAEKLLNKASAHGLVHKKNAIRRTSRLYSRIQKAAAAGN